MNGLARQLGWWTRCKATGTGNANRVGQRSTGADDRRLEHLEVRTARRMSQDRADNSVMSLTSAPPLPSPSIDRVGEAGRSEAVYLGKRRVPLMVAVLCLLLAWGRGRHFHYLLAQGSGDHAVKAAITGNALLLGVVAFIAATAMMNAVLGFPRLTVTRQGLTRRSLFRTTTAEWNSLSRFHIERLNGGKTVSATADIIGPNASRKLLRGKARVFKIADTYRTPIELIAAEIHGRQTEAMGGPAPLPRAAGAAVVPEYGVAGFRLPWVTFGLIVVLIAVFVAEHRQGVAPEAAPLKPDFLTLYAFGALNRGALLHHGELLRLFSSTLLHSSKAHLVGNVAALLLVGWPLERLIGRALLLAIFMVSGLAGSILGLVVYPASTTLVGASGGITGLFAAMVAFSFRLPTRRKRTLMIVRAALGLIAAFMPSEIQDGARIAYAAHLGGVPAGVVLGILLLRTWNEACRLPRFRRTGLAVGTGGLALALLGIPVSLHLSREFVASVQGCARGDPDTRVRGCTALLDGREGSEPVTLLHRGNAYAAKKQYDPAIVDFDRLIALAPGSAQAFVARGYAYAGKGLYNRSIPDFTKAIELDSKFSIAYLDRGGAYLDEGNIDLAIADEDRAIALDPTLAGAYAFRGKAYSRKGGTGEAIADYSSAIALNPSDGDTYFNRGVEYLRENRFDEAVADTTKALELQPANAAAYNNRAWALHRKGEDPLALPDAEKAVVLAPSRVPPLETRAEIYEKLGRRRDAVADYRAALAIDGSLQLARDGLKRLNADPRNPP